MDKLSLKRKSFDSGFKLMLQGLSARLSEEMDFFIALEGEFKSGIKTFSLKGELAENQLKLSFEGRTILISPEELSETIGSFATRFDKVTLNYIARGESLTLEADEKNVTMKTKRLAEDREQVVKGHSEAGSLSGRDYLIKVGKADDLLKEIGIMAQNGKIKNDKQSLNKLKLMLQGLSARLSEEMDFFIALEGEFKSGIKTFSLKGELAENQLKLSFEGRTILISPEELSETIGSFATRFDKVTLNYIARGESLTLEADEKNVTMKTKRLAEDREQVVKGHSEAGSLSGRDYLIKVGKADDLLKEIGIMAQNGKIKNDMIRKYNQIDHFVELLDPMLKELARGKTELRIVDCACGKSYLSFVLNYYIKEILKLNCRFTGIDISEGVIGSSREIARHLGYRNMHFIQGDIRSLLYEEEGTGAIQPDLVISLHACDIATDFALAYGIRNRARGIVCVPCCHSEVLSQYSFEPFKDILKHGVLKARMADVLTDGLRCMILEAFGYTVSAVEYVSPLDTPKNLLIR